MWWLTFVILANAFHEMARSYNSSHTGCPPAEQAATCATSQGRETKARSPSPRSMFLLQDVTGKMQNRTEDMMLRLTTQQTLPARRHQP